VGHRKILTWSQAQTEKKNIIHLITGNQLVVHLHLADIPPDLAIPVEIPSVFVLEKLSSFPQRFGQIRTNFEQDF